MANFSTCGKWFLDHNSRSDGCLGIIFLPRQITSKVSINAFGVIIKTLGVFFNTFGLITLADICIYDIKFLSLHQKISV